MKVCYRCGQEVEIGRTVGRTEACPHCDGDLHCCFNCKFYDGAAPHECREPLAEPVSDKEKGNFCGYFLFRDAAETQQKLGPSASARKKLDRLFKRPK